MFLGVLFIVALKEPKYPLTSKCKHIILYRYYNGMPLSNKKEKKKLCI